jgi:streptogramin lyase
LRGLKALVAVLGVLIVLGTATVIGVVITRIYASPAAPSMSAGAGPAVLPAGSRIMGVAAAGGVFAVWVSGTGGDRVYLVDPRTGGVRLVVSGGK